MAPDLNSVPPSPHALASRTSPPAPQHAPRIRSRTTSRRTSQQLMSPPTLPPSSPTSLNILPSNQSAVAHASAPLGSPGLPTTTGITAGGPLQGGDNTGVGTGPGPLRHPRPLTAADLHLQLEKEQEAVVNRLTRELSLLRAAQNASVVSNTSSTSASGLPDAADTNANHLLSGPSHPIPSQRRHHRSSSSTSTRSIPAGSISTVGGVAGSVSSGFGNLPSTTADRTRGTMHRHDSSTSQGPSLSRQDSITGSRASGASSPAQASLGHGADGFPSFYQRRPSFPQNREPSSGSLAGLSTGLGNDGVGRTENVVTSVQTTGRYEEAAYHRHELEAVKSENETLKRRIRELERTLRERRQSDASVSMSMNASRGVRSESVSTTASVRDGLSGGASQGGAGRGRDKEKDGEGEDGGVRVGESARGVGR